MTKPFWDFDETTNYIYYLSPNDNYCYKVLDNYKDYLKAIYILEKLRIIINEMCKFLSINFYHYSDKDKIAIKCFLDIHPNNYLLSEMQMKQMFEGLNKPRNLYSSNDEILGSDGKDRAQYRDVFLQLRKNNKFKSYDSIIKLTIHEITHTMCNHIRWRDDDHGSDFKYYEKILLDVYKEVIQFEKILQKIIDLKKYIIYINK